MSAESVARLVAQAEGLDLGYLRGLTRRRDASGARVIVGYLARAYGRTPYAWTVNFFNRDPSTLSRDIRAFEASLTRDRGRRAKLRKLADRL